MTTLVQLALAFASIIVIGTLAAWLHDALEARGPVARARDRYLRRTVAPVSSRSAARPRPVTPLVQTASARLQSRSPAPHGAMRVVARRLGSHVVDV